MTTNQVRKRAEKAQGLPVFQIAEGLFFVQSEEGKICYRVDMNGEVSCTCADFTKNSKTNPEFKCKHVLAVLDSETSDKRQIEVLSKRKPRLNDQFIINLRDKDFVLYAGLLDLSHQRGLLKLEVEPIQYPSKENGMEAICKATATTKTGEVFVDIGDANPGNTNKMIAQHLIRMASTRAKARVLRDMNNIGMTALEELGDLDEVVSDNKNPSQKMNKRTGKKAKVTPIAKDKKTQNNKDETKTEKPVPTEDQDKGSRPKMSEAQKRAIANLSRRRGISETELQHMVMEEFGVALESLSSPDAASFIRRLQQSA